MEFTAELVEKAVQQFYHDSSSQREAHQWLTNAQRSSAAWSYVWELLDHSKPDEVQYFAASTLHMKVSRRWQELTVDHYEPLKQKLMQYILTYSCGPKLIFSRLCITLASFIIHTIDEYWKEAVNEVIIYLDVKSVPNLSSEQLSRISIEIFKAVPEEFQTSYIAAERKGNVRNSLSKSSTIVLAWLENMLTQRSDNSSFACRIKCLNSWIVFGADLNEIEKFIPFLLKATNIEELNESCLEAFESIILHPTLSRFPQFINKLVVSLLSMEPLLKQAVNDGDLDLCKRIYSVVALLCETHSRSLLEDFYENTNHREQILQLLNIMIECSRTSGQYPIDETCSEIASNIWYILQDDVLVSEPAKTAVYLQYFVPLYKTLIDALLTKVCYPSDESFSSMSSEERQQLSRYRQNISDILLYCYNVLRESMLNILLSHITVILQMPSKDSQWQQLEACLFALQSVSGSVPVEENNFLPSFFSCLSNIPLSNLRITATALDVIGSYSDWISAHVEVLDKIIPLLLAGLHNADIALSATLSLKEISRSCQHAIKPFIESIMLACQNALQENVINSSERIRLIATVGIVLSTSPTETIMSYLNRIIIPYVNLLQSISCIEPSVAVRDDLLLSLNMLSMLFCSLDTNAIDEEETTQQPQIIKPGDCPPVLIILEQIMPVIVKIGLAWCSHDVDVTKTTCLMLKRASSTLLDDYSPMLPSTLNFLLEMHTILPNFHCLDLANQLILLFCEEKTHKQMIIPFLEHVVDVTLNFANKDFRNSTDIIESFLQMISKIMKKKPTLLPETSIAMTTIFFFGILSLGLPESPTVKAASQFLTGFINTSAKNTNMSQAVNENGEILLGYLFKIIGGEAPRCMVDYVPDILISLNKNYFDNLRVWMNSISSNNNLPSPAISHRQKEHYSRLILRERNNRRRLLDVVKEYSLLCRGLIATEYARQTS